jgi:peptidoglycan/xylan/chitin deacetylase (PgdA/CDA1 family)
VARLALCLGAGAVALSACSPEAFGVRAGGATPSPSSASAAGSSPSGLGAPTAQADPSGRSTAQAPTEDPVAPSAPPTRIDVTSTPSRDGLIPVLTRIPTTDRVVFITIDDGYTRDPRVLSLLAARHLPVTPFLTVDAVRRHDSYFAQVQVESGQHVQNHSVSHPHLKGRSLAAQEAEICGASTTLASWFGASPWLFRPPYGSYDDTTRRAAAACGSTALVLWDVSLPHDVLRFSSGTRFRPGDILLIHWRPGLARDLPIALAAIAADGLRVGALQDYLPRP